MNCLSNIQLQLLKKLQKSGQESNLSHKEKSIFLIIQNRPNIQSGEIAEKLAIPASGIIEKEGNGRNISYTIK